MARFALQVDSEVDLVLREPWTDVPLYELAVANLDRLREWEPWAQGEQTVEITRAYARAQLRAWVDGTVVPTAIRVDGRLVGSASARINAYARTAEVGYWLDRDAVGRGIATRATGALVDHLSTELGVRRVEIRASMDNRRSRAVAERLGFSFEGRMRAAMAVGDRVDDVALYSRLFLDG